MCGRFRRQSGQRSVGARQDRTGSLQTGQKGGDIGLTASQHAAQTAPNVGQGSGRLHAAHAGATTTARSPSVSDRTPGSTRLTEQAWCQQREVTRDWENQPARAGDAVQVAFSHMREPRQRGRN
jgi:hypothetical protein